jgi:hypothetical protein
MIKYAQIQSCWTLSHYTILQQINKKNVSALQRNNKSTLQFEHEPIKAFQYCKQKIPSFQTEKEATIFSQIILFQKYIYKCNFKDY